MAGPKAQFAWWGDGAASSALLSAYAYYADFYASKALGVTLPAEHWQRVLEIYRDVGQQETLLQRAMVVTFAREMGLPVSNLVDGLLADWTLAKVSGSEWNDKNIESSLLMSTSDSAMGLAAAGVLTANLAKKEHLKLNPAQERNLAAANKLVAAGSSWFLRALQFYINGGDEQGRQQLLAQISPEMPTMERAVALQWLQAKWGNKPAVSLSPVGTWKVDSSDRIVPQWRFVGKASPVQLKFDHAPTSNVKATLEYRSNVPGKSELPVTISRRLYRLVPGTEAMTYDAVEANVNELHSDILYLDEIRLEPKANANYRYGLLEVPLPPGADVEPTTWGVNIKWTGATQYNPLDKVTYQSGDLQYAMPLPLLNETTVIRRLVRFGSKGKFALPPSRYFQMYQPEHKAYENNGETKMVRVL